MMVQWELNRCPKLLKTVTRTVERTKYFFHWISTDNYSQCKLQIKNTNKQLQYTTAIVQQCNGKKADVQSLREQ